MDGTKRIEEVISLVLGEREMTAPEILVELRKRHGRVLNVHDALGMIRYLLASRRQLFERVEGKVGHYRRKQRPQCTTE